MDSHFARAALCSIFLAALLGVVSSGPDYCRTVPNCFTCKESDRIGRPLCTRCNEQLFFLDTDPNSGLPYCRNCSELSGCLSCYTKQRCIRCRNPWPPGSGTINGPNLSGGVGTCGPCSANCRACNESGSGKCDICTEGYFVDANGLCEECALNCKACNGAFCFQCENGFYRQSDGTCGVCETRHCAQCTSNGKSCTKCLSGPVSSTGACADGVGPWRHSTSRRLRVYTLLPSTAMEQEYRASTYPRYRVIALMTNWQYHLFL